MKKELFPIIDLPAANDQTAALPMFRDIALDRDTGLPRFDARGEPIMAEGLDALLGWAVNAVRTERFRWEIFDFSYGCEILRLVGQAYSADAKLAEAARYLTEALLVNPYIKAVRVTNAAFSGTTFSADIMIDTIYGEENIHV